MSRANRYGRPILEDELALTGLQGHGEVFQYLMSRIIRKDAEKGASYQHMTIEQLRALLRDEIHELDQAIALEGIDEQIAEALDVTICGLLIVSKLLMEAER